MKLQLPENTYLTPEMVRKIREYLTTTTMSIGDIARKMNVPSAWVMWVMRDR